MTSKGTDSPAFVSLALIGAFVVLTAVGAAYWWVAHQMTWWTFALLFSGGWILIEFVKGLIKEIRK